MTRTCFFVEDLKPTQETVSLTGQTAHHMGRVLRMRVGDSVEIRDGQGNGWQGIIAAAEEGVFHVRLLAKQPLLNESSLKLTLAMAFSRMDRMELVLRQATELGVHRFVAFRSVRSQYNLSGTQLSKRRERWMRVAREALCQSGRMILPQISILPDTTAFLSGVKIWETDGSKSLRLLAKEGEHQNTLLATWRCFPVCEEVLAVIGPEGGWSRHEVEQFLMSGFSATHLGPRTLRLETAAVAFLAMIQLLWGDSGLTERGANHEMP